MTRFSVAVSPWRFPLAMAFLLALTSPQLWAGEKSCLPKADARVENGMGARQRVIVALHDPGDLSRMPAAPEGGVTRQPRGRSLPAAAFEQHKAKVMQALRAVPGDAPRVVHELRPLRMMVLEVTPDHLVRLRTLDDVGRVWPDVILEAQLDTSLPYVQAQTFQQSHARGAGTAVAVLDTPVRAHLPAFGSCPSPGAPGCPIRLQLDFTGSSLEDVMAREDQLGIGSHGSNVAGVVLGMAPDTRILGLNVFHIDPVTGGVVANLSDTLAAMAWVADNAHAYGIVAVNASLGTYRTDPGACNDSASFGTLRNLHRDHGVLTVTVSGNDALSNAVRDPGCVSSAMAVGALFDQDTSWYGDAYCSQEQPRGGQLACFSNLNGLVDIVAPGVGVSAGGYTMTGTSQAAPHVAGAIAAWQSFYLAKDGAFRSAAWMQRNLLASSTAPLIHRDSRSFSQLRMEQGVDWTYAHAFGWWYEELPDNAIPSSNPGLSEKLTIDAQPWNVKGAYLYLEVVHPKPQDVQVTLTSPAGKEASFHLPHGQANFTGLVGRSVFPGVLGPIAGSPANGTWTLSLRDTQGNGTGHYLQGALYLVGDGCTPSCEGQGCGDDQCGGRCGDVCVIDGSCKLEGPSAENPCIACRPTVQVGAWTTLHGDACDSGQICSGPGTCQMGQCVSQPMDCPAPGSCEGQGACDPSTGSCVYAPLADGTACDDADECTAGDACRGGRCEGERICGGGSADEVPVQPAAGGRPEAAESSGCGCRSVTKGPSGPGALWLGVLLFAWARRRATQTVEVRKTRIATPGSAFLCGLLLGCSAEPSGTSLPDAGGGDTAPTDAVISDPLPDANAPDSMEAGTDAWTDNLDGNSPEGDSVEPGGWMALIGGGAEGDLGDDSAWSASVYGWIVDKANHGKIVIVAAQPQTDFLSSYFVSLGASEAVDVTIGTSAEAANPQNLQQLKDADGIFLKGGDQWAYLSAWLGSEVPTVLDEAVKSGKVLAGTSAGAHVLSGVAYDARNGSVRPGEALRDPFDSRITFTHGFLSLLPHTIVDTHFTERGRLARLAPMLARLMVSDAPDVRVAMGLDDRTALLVDPQGRAEVSGEGSVTVLQRIAETQVEATPLRPPHVRSLRMDVLGDGYAIDMNTLQIVGHPSNAAPVLVEPVLEASTPVTLSGSDAEAAKQGSLALEFESAYALFDGDLEVVAGTGALPGFLVVSQTFAQSQSSMVENRVGGVQWALHEAGATVPFSLLLDEGAVVTVDATGKFLAQSVESEPAVLILDGLGLEETARTPYLPRQSVSLLGLRLHLLRSGEDWAKPKGR